MFNDNDSLNDEEENTRTRKDLSDDNSTFLETIIEETSKRRAKKQRARKRRTKKPMRIKCETLECAVKGGLIKGFLNIIGIVLSL